MTEVEETSSQLEKLSVEDSSASTGTTEKTVFDSTDDFTVVHPLTHKWTLWYVKPPSEGEDWHDLLKEVVTVSTVEEFWGTYRSLPRVSDLPVKADYAFFRSGISPEWEDPRNSNGGKWAFQLRDARKTAPVDSIWLKLLLKTIGGTLDQIDADEEVNGIFVNVRKAGIKFNVWTKSRQPESVKPIGVSFKDALGLADRDQVEFTSHDSKNKNKITL